MKLKKFLTNRYSSLRNRKDILLGRLNPKINIEPENRLRQITIETIFTCKCGRGIYDHPVMTVGNHYRSMPYYGDLCPFIAIGE